MDRSLSLLVKFAAIDRLTAPLRRMSVGSRAAGREIAATRREVTTLERSMGKIGAYRDLEVQIGKTGEKLGYARARVDALTKAIDQADGPTGRLSAQLLVATRSVERLESASGTQAERLASMAEELRAAGVDVGALADAETRLGTAVAEANDRLAEQQKVRAEQSRQAERLDRAERRGERLRSTGTRMMAVGIATGAPLIAAAKASSEWNEKLTSIAITAGLAREQAGQLGNDLQRLAPQVAQLPDALAEGFGTLTAAGLKATDAWGMMKAIGRTATAEQAEVNDLANASFAVFNNLKVPIGQNAKALDTMTLAGQKGGVELKDMARSFPALTAAAQGLGQSGVSAVADLSAALQIAKNGAKDADEASNNLLNLLNKINTKEATDNFKKLGVDLPRELKRAYAAGKTPAEAIAELTNKALKGDMTRLSYLFNDAQVQAALRPLIAGLDRYRQIRKEAMGADGVVNKDFDRRLAEDPEAQKRIARGNLSGGINTVGKTVDPVWTGAQVAVGNLAARYSELATQYPRLTRYSTLAAIGVAALSTAFGALLIAAGVVWPYLVKGWAILSRLGGAFRFLGLIVRAALSPVQLIIRGLMIGLTAIAAFVGLPVWLVGAIAAALVLAGVLIWKNWGTIREKLGGLWMGIKGAFSNGLAALRGMLPSFAWIGRMMIEGLLTALNPARLVIAIGNLGKLAIGALRRVLGIKSPSRVFHEIGGFMMAGLDRGLERGTQAPLDRLRDVGKALAGGATIGMASMANGAAPPVYANNLGPRVEPATIASAAPLPVYVTDSARPAASSGGQGASPQTIVRIDTVTIVVKQQPGEDGQALAGRIRREIEGLASTRNTRAASSFEDVD